MDKSSSRLLDVDILCYNIEYGVNLIFAVHTAITEGSYAEESFTDALYAAFDYLYDKQKQLREAVDGLLEERRQSKHC